MTNERRGSPRLALPDTLYQTTPVSLVHSRFLWGTQLPSEYSASKLARIKTLLNSDGIAYLYAYPLSCVLVSTELHTYLAILDGHHRARTAGTCELTYIPAYVFTLEKVAAAVSLEVSVLSQVLCDWIFEAVEGFEASYDLSRKVYEHPLELTPQLQSIAIQPLPQQYGDHSPQTEVIHGSSSEKARASLQW